MSRFMRGTLIVALGTLGLLLFACSSSDDDGDGGEVADATATTTATATATTTAAAATATPAATGTSASVRTPTAEPGMEDGPSQADLIAIGKEVYETPGLCITCHGPRAEGVIGPPIAGQTAEMIELQFEINDAMQGIRLSDEELLGLEAYLATLVQ